MDALNKISERAMVAEELGAEPVAKALRWAYGIVASEWDTRGDELVTVREAHEISGYSIVSLRKMSATGHLPNYSDEPNKLLFRRGDLPKKPGYKVKKNARNYMLPVAVKADGALPSTRELARVIKESPPRGGK